MVLTVLLLEEQPLLFLLLRLAPCVLLRAQPPQLEKKAQQVASAG